MIIGKSNLTQNSLKERSNYVIIADGESALKQTDRSFGLAQNVVIAEIDEINQQKLEKKSKNIEVG